MKYFQTNPLHRRVCFLLFMSVLSGFRVTGQDLRFSFTQSKMGSPFTIILFAPDSSRGKELADQSFYLVDSLVSILSDYADSSELNRLCARAGIAPFNCSPTLYDILLRSRTAFEQSDGKFDITVGPLSRLWRAARKANRFPESSEVNEKKALTGFQAVHFNDQTRSVYLEKKGMQLDLGGIGQGYIAAHVAAFLKSRAVYAALIDVSGDIVAIGKPPGKEGWTVAINVPESERDLLPRHLQLSNTAVTTSGDVYQFMLHNGRKYSHIIDPGTGYGITSQQNVTVIARDGASADWLTKAFSLLPLAKAKKLARLLDAEFMITELKAGKIQSYRSRSFDTYWKKEPR